MPKLPEPNSISIMPSGTYLVRILSYEKMTAKTGTPQIRWKAEVVDPEESAGRIIVEHTPLTDKSVWKVANLIYSCGISFKPNVDTDSAYFDGLCNATKGRLSYWRNEEGVDNMGNPRNKIVRYERSTNQEELLFDLEEEKKPAWLEEENG